MANEEEIRQYRQEAEVEVEVEVSPLQTSLDLKAVPIGMREHLVF